MGCFILFKRKNRQAQKPSPKSPAAQPSPAKKPAAVADAGSRRQRSPTSLSPGSLPALEKEWSQRLRSFEVEELRKATNGFNRALKIGEGGFGRVYKGFFRRSAPDGRVEKVVVAVKVLRDGSKQGNKEFVAELQFLGVLEHPNLVKLVGYCAVDADDGEHRMLVYEFMPNRSLEDHLFNSARPPLPWKARLQIILGAAEGLAYLHEGNDVQVIYRDFKASNILLDADFRAKLSDFGLAREGPTGDQTHVSTDVVGTHGYAAPDYMQTGHLSSTSDVWSFGVVLYEILTGRRSLDTTRPPAEQRLLRWVRNFPPDGGSFILIMDARLGGQYPLDAALEIAALADRCLLSDPKARPKMSQVVQALKQIMEIQ